MNRGRIAKCKVRRARGRGYVLCVLLYALGYLLFALPSGARVAGNCSNCHTMHNSQDGKAVARGDAPWGSTGGETDAMPSLLVASCLGCHSSSVANESIREFDSNRIPIVFNTSGYPNNPLAGGNFYSVTLDDTLGHNIFISNPDDLLEAPGSIPSACSGNNICHKNLNGVVSGVGGGLDGKQGCEKCHLNPKHHANDPYPAGGLVTSAEQGWYRFLSGHDSGTGDGVEGYEDGDWEKTVSFEDHNEYLGYQNPRGNGFIDLGHTTTAYCTGCHGRFHTDQGTASPWLRHPSDAVLPNSGEYLDYIGTNKYNPVVPVARPSLSGSPSGDVSVGDMVMCLSCHRAHASPFFKMMRWNYKSLDLAEALSGCNVCHSSKN